MKLKLTFLLFVIPLIGIKAQTACWNTGDGSDDTFHPTQDTLITSGTFNFSSVTIDEGIHVTVQGNDPLIIYCSGNMVINGTISVNGGNGFDGITYSSGGNGGIGVAGGANGGIGSFIRYRTDRRNSWFKYWFWRSRNGLVWWRWCWVWNSWTSSRC